jgi:thioredoxin 1
MNTSVIEVNELSLNESLSYKELSVIDVWAPWCGPCKQLSPILEEVNKEVGDSVFIGKLNADDNMEACKTYNVRNIPTLLLFKNGELVDRMSGLKSKKEILDFISKQN